MEMRTQDSLLSHSPALAGKQDTGQKSSSLTTFFVSGTSHCTWDSTWKQQIHLSVSFIRRVCEAWSKLSQCPPSAHHGLQLSLHACAMPGCILWKACSFFQYSASAALILSWQADESSGCSIVIAPACHCVCHSVLIAWLLLPVHHSLQQPSVCPCPCPCPVTL